MKKSTGLFSDEEDDYNIDETKYKLKIDEPNDNEEVNFNDEDLNLGDEGDENNDNNDKPFDDEPFDPGIEADEETEPDKYIQQLTGKLAQTLRKYTKDNGEPDFELEKFVVNSIISATHTGEMEPDDQRDIIKKVKTSGKGEGDINVNVDVDTDADNENVSVDGEEETDKDVEDFNESLDFKKKIKENLVSIKKNSIFVGETKINEDMEIEPITIPKEPKTKPSRRKKTWRPNKKPKTNPKATK